MSRQSVRRACEENAGNIIFFRRSHLMPCICVEAFYDHTELPDDGQFNYWKRLPLNELDELNFIKYRNKITAYISVLQSDRRSMQNRLDTNPTILHIPEPMERALLAQLFNNHLNAEEKRRYLIEYSNTIITSGTCYHCLQYSLLGKRKCLHFDCPGMCVDCYEGMGDSCPACKKKQVAQCPICKDEKTASEMCHHGSRKCFARCGHPVCWSCLGKAYAMGKPLTKCPLCRASWVQHRVAAEPEI